MESVFELLEMAKFLNKLPLSNDDKINWKEIINSLIKLIVFTIERSCIYNKIENFSVEVLYEYKIMFEDLLKLESFDSPIQHNLSFITLNYDMLLEMAINTVKKYGQNLNSSEKNELPFHYGFNNEKFKSQIPIYKLHGSLNWVLSNEYEADYNPKSELKIKSNDSYFDFINFLTDDITDNYSINTFSTDNYVITSSEQLPLIVPPTWNKIREYDQLKIVWQNAFEDLSNADNIVIMGYSLPDSDQVFKRFFSLAMSGKKPIRKILLVDPNIKNTLPRFKNLLGNNALQRLYVMSYKLEDFKLESNEVDVKTSPIKKTELHTKVYSSTFITRFLTDTVDKGAGMIKHYTEFEKD